MQLDELIITIFCQIDDKVKAQFPVRSLRQRGPLPYLTEARSSRWNGLANISA